MAVFACSVLMARYGIKCQNLAFAKPISVGMATSAKETQHAQVEEYTIKNIKSASVLTVKYGMEPTVLLESPAAVENNGMIQVYNVTVQQLSTGMDAAVYFAQTEKFGILPQEHAFVKLELNGTINFVLLFKIVRVEQSGIKTPGLANVHPPLSGLTIIVWLILVLVAKFGTI